MISPTTVSFTSVAGVGLWCILHWQIVKKYMNTYIYTYGIHTLLVMLGMSTTCRPGWGWWELVLGSPFTVHDYTRLILHARKKEERRRHDRRGLLHALPLGTLVYLGKCVSGKNKIEKTWNGQFYFVLCKQSGFCVNHLYLGVCNCVCVCVCLVYF